MIKKIISICFILLLFYGAYWVLSQPPKNIDSIDSNKINTISDTIPSPQTSSDKFDLVFYWGDGCPHCENVEKWLKENNSDNQLKISYKEVYTNKTNQTELYDIAKQYCPEIIDNGNIGVPTGFDPLSKKCIQGDTPIIDFLSDKLTK